MRAVILALVWALPAQAGWRLLGTLTGTPADVVVADAGLVLASSRLGNGQALALQALADGGTAQLAMLSGPQGYVGAAMNGGCFSALSLAKVLEFSDGCAASVTLTPTGNVEGYRASGTEAVALFTSGAGNVQVVSAAMLTTATSWIAQTPAFPQSAASRGLGFLKQGPVSYAVASSTQVPGGVRLSVDGGSPGPLVGVPASDDAVPFALEGVVSVLSLTTTGGLVVVPDVAPRGRRGPAGAGVDQLRRGALARPGPRPPRVALGAARGRAGPRRSGPLPRRALVRGAHQCGGGVAL